jgi:hypothetical protein
VVENVHKVIESSEYSSENKGNYKGSLGTRLKSLTNGINGLIFTSDELTNDALFDNNVIIDLSRIGSMETKALIMGLLVMKLQEYRTTSGRMNSGLKHLTVLEEAHNLLKRTSTEQSSESSNLLGKSVEMLANAIAEMRTYGEGFIIADQSPGLLDMSVIRNTNTKIIMRLPDESDRVLVGKAANLTDEQIVELAKLQCGVAAVYQNDWLQPVLCKVKEYKQEDMDFKYQKTDNQSLEKTSVLSELKRISLGNHKAENLKEKIEAVGFETFKALDAKTVAGLFANHTQVFCNAKQAVGKTGIRGLHDYLIAHIKPEIKDLPDIYQQHILKCVIELNCAGNQKLKEVPDIWSEFIRTGVKYV